MIDIYKKIINDKGSTKAGTVNNPLSFYLVDNDNTEVEFLNTNVITANILFGGKWDAGIPLGRMTMMSAPSKFLKTFMALSVIKSAQKKGLSVIVIYTERRFPYKSAIGMKIDKSKEKLLVLQENSIEEVKTIILKVLDVHFPSDKMRILSRISSSLSLCINRVMLYPACINAIHSL